MHSRSVSCSRPAACVMRSSPSDVTSDRKSTRLNSSHDQISYAVFCLKKKKKQSTNTQFKTYKRQNNTADSARVVNQSPTSRDHATTTTSLKRQRGGYRATSRSWTQTG